MSDRTTPTLNVASALRSTITAAGKLDSDVLGSPDIRLLARMVGILAVVCDAQEKRIADLEADRAAAWRAGR